MAQGFVANLLVLSVIITLLLLFYIKGRFAWNPDDLD